MRRWQVMAAAGLCAGALAGCAWFEEGEPAAQAAAPAPAPVPAAAPASDAVRLDCERRARAEHPGVSIGDVALGNRFAQRRFVEECLKEQGQPLQ